MLDQSEYQEPEEKEKITVVCPKCEGSGKQSYSRPHCYRCDDDYDSLDGSSDEPCSVCEGRRYVNVKAYVVHTHNWIVWDVKFNSLHEYFICTTCQRLKNHWDK